MVFERSLLDEANEGCADNEEEGPSSSASSLLLLLLLVEGAAALTGGAEIAPAALAWGNNTARRDAGSSVTMDDVRP